MASNFGFSSPQAQVGTYTPTSSPYGTQPQVPLPTATAPGAISGNLGDLGSIYGLSTGTGAASGAGAAAQYNTLLPGIGGLLGQGSGDVSSELSGQLPADVINQIEQAGAERGISTGSPGSDNSNAAMLESIGLTSLGLEEQGQQDLSRLIGETPTGPAFNPASMFVTPDQQQQAAAANAIYASAPNPTAAARADMAAVGNNKVPGMMTGGPGGGLPMVPTPLSPSGYGPNPAAVGGLGPFPTATGTGTLGGMYNLPTGNTYGNTSPEDDWVPSGLDTEVNIKTGETREAQGGGSYYAGPDLSNDYNDEEGSE